MTSILLQGKLDRTPRMYPILTASFAAIYIYLWISFLGNIVLQSLATPAGLDIRFLPSFTVYHLLMAAHLVLASIFPLLLCLAGRPGVKAVFVFHRPRPVFIVPVVFLFLAAIILAVIVDECPLPYVMGIPVLACGTLHLAAIAFCEELVFRHLVFGQLLWRLSFKMSFLISAVVFYLAHIHTFWFSSVSSALGFAILAIGVSYVLSALYVLQRRSILLGIFVHMIVDVPVLQATPVQSGLTISTLAVTIGFMAVLGTMCGSTLRGIFMLCSGTSASHPSGR